ncbi:polysaccharide biosynthesis tyrosine autokinase [Aggregatimonas sangjinii]|uniref:non-specific protein-tyrosine kinase n=1 Tax=Aggregatimonas sangjinii TaxID=2583587 RepID=A0A5B7SJN4_9FLAO|nr:polysaccharide biosynthesis tyrosine autokinase [Aggregatimonas sangjinii]QCW98775.1 polysaccharide biosynthesis tyrosine autokinase [Aggregatimonas sangjinii]
MLSNDTYSNHKDNLFSILADKFVPFWPLFLGLFLLGLLSAWTYLFLSTPTYSVSAALIINDEKKGVDDSEIMESINVFTSKKIVENEVEVLHSKELINEVVYELNLYTQVFEKGLFKNTPVYDTSPIHIRLKSPNDSRYYQDDNKTSFDFDSAKNLIRIDDKSYPIGEWVENPFGGDPIKFIRNTAFEESSDDQKSYYFTFIHPKLVSASIYNKLYVGSSSKLSTVVRMTYEDANTTRGEDIVNQLIKSYIQQSTRERDTLASNTLAFVENRMEQVGIELNEVEKELEVYRSSEGVVNISKQGSLYLDNVGNYDRRIGDIELQLAVLQKVQNYVVSKNKSSGIVPSTLGINDPILSQLLDRLYNAEIEYEELRKTTAENNPILVAVKNRIDQIRPSILENVNSQKANLRTSLANLNSSSGKYNSALQLLPEQERKLVEITRKKKNISELYDFLAQKREETALSYAPTQGDARIIEGAEASLRPVSPKKTVVYAIALLLSFAIGILIVSGKELISSKVLFRSAVERYSKLPVIGELAFLDQNSTELLVNEHKDVFILDQFRHLLSSLGIYQRSSRLKTLMVTSSIAGEGKSYVSANLAQTLAFSGKRVALVDMDLRNASLTTIFNLEEEEGVSDFLSNKAVMNTIVHKSDCEELYILPCGEKTFASSELLASKKLEELFETLYDTFDYVVVDTPPISMVSDAAIINEFGDKTLIVVRHGYTPKHVAKRIDENLNNKNFKNCNIVFNAVKQRGVATENYGYGHGYGYDLVKPQKSDTFLNGIIDFFKLRPTLEALKKLAHVIQFTRK